MQAKCNPCLSSPCRNQGTCHNDPLGSYRCACPIGYKVMALGLPAQGARCRGMVQGSACSQQQGVDGGTGNRAWYPLLPCVLPSPGQGL